MATREKSCCELTKSCCDARGSRPRFCVWESSRRTRRRAALAAGVRTDTRSDARHAETHAYMLPSGATLLLLQ